jgi:hypothetical protein
MATGQARSRRNLRQLAIELRDGSSLLDTATNHSVHEENAPSRWRLRPASRLTAAEAAADRRAINLGRSVLGACGTLGGAIVAVKERRGALVANCDLFFSQQACCGSMSLL